MQQLLSVSCHRLSFIGSENDFIGSKVTFIGSSSCDFLNSSISLAHQAIKNRNATSEIHCRTEVALLFNYMMIVSYHSMIFGTILMIIIYFVFMTLRLNVELAVCTLTI